MRRLLLLSGVFVLVVSSTVWGKGRPIEIPVKVVEITVTAEHNVQASWAWWVGYAGYLELGPFASAQACETARVRFPVRYRCLAVRD